MKKILSLIIIIFYFLSTRAQERQVTVINDNWKYYDAYNFERKATKQFVTLPHTWNVAEIMDGVMEYRRTAGYYERNITYRKEWDEKRIFLHFEGANSVADIWVNNKYVANHKGGYTAFTIEITKELKPGDNRLLVMVSNAIRTDVLPLHGDFNIYGGLHRPVSLIVTSKNCITPLDYGAAGVYVQQKSVTKMMADLLVKTVLSIQEQADGLTLKTIILNKDSTVVATATSPVNKNAPEQLQQLQINKPHLWNGFADPYLYQVKTQLQSNGQVIDEVAVPLGLRFFSLDANKGFFLNESYLDLYGFGKHDDYFNKGTAALPEDYNKDFELIRESGATSLRLTHYPHNQYFYDGCDREGVVLWTEIPFVGPGGYTGTGYVKTKELESHIIQVTKEMVKQNYNHPSVIFWGLGNELKIDFDDPQPFLQKLNAMVKEMDPQRITTYASNLGANQFTQVSDAMAWNQYFGWYGGSFERIGSWANQTHQTLPDKPIAISEYGAGASPFHHIEILKAPTPTGKFHPEEWQTAFHEAHWRQLKERPFIWGKYIWAFADFSSSIRTEGDRNGINDKGLITYDRKIKKDAFFFYKANWNREDMVYIAERRNDKRKEATVNIKVYTNMEKVTLFVNGKSLATQKPDSVKIAIWENVPLQLGNNTIEARGIFRKKLLYDKVVWERVAP